MPKQVIFSSHSKGLDIQEFKMNDMCNYPAICMIAKRRSGKSWVCRNILRHFGDIPGGVIISPTEEMSCFYGKFFPNLFIHYAYKPEILANLFERQQIMLDKVKYYYKKKKRIDPRSFLIMDDCLASKGTWMKDEEIATMFFNGRHYKVMYILTMQFPLGIKPEYRCNFDYIFLLFDDFISNQKRLFEHYAGMFGSFDLFKQVFTQLTEDYGCMVIVNNGAKKLLVEKVFYYRADDSKVDKIGCDQFKNYHKNNFNPGYKYATQKFNINDFAPKTNKPNIAVKKVKHQSSDES
jgi:hypothetical protein